jgi:excisionase family DNA binding protein
VNNLMSIKEAALRLGLSEWTIRKWIYGKRLDSVKLGRAVRVPSEAVDRMIASGLTKADAIQ